jgi:hypothetical protein
MTTPSLSNPFLTVSGQTLTLADHLSGRAPLASPTFSGTPTASNGTKTPRDVYGAIIPTIDTDRFTDTLVGIRQIPTGHNLGNNVPAVSGYIWNESTRGAEVTNAGNGVALFGAGVSAGNGARTWGLNTILQDAPTRAVSAITGAHLLCELDYNVMSADTEVIGLSIGGNSLAQPKVANGFQVAPLGNGSVWKTAFWSQGGASEVAFAAGSRSGAPVSGGSAGASQPLWLQWFDSSSQPQVTQVYMQDGFLIWTNVPGGYKFDGGPVEASAGYYCGTNQVVGARDTGWSAPTGTSYKGPLAADDTQAILATYDQNQIQTLQNQLVEARRAIAAMQRAMIAHGLIGS